MLPSAPATAPNVFHSVGTPSNRAETARPAGVQETSSWLILLGGSVTTRDISMTAVAELRRRGVVCVATVWQVDFSPDIPAARPGYPAMVVR
jgi:hypothetical protein